MRYNFRMDFTDKFGLAPNYLDDSLDIHRIQAAAVESLERIQSIYKEIMAPGDISSPISDFDIEKHQSPADSPETEQRSGTVLSDHAVNELCINCRNVISRCNHCRFCISSDLNDSSGKSCTRFRQETLRKRHERFPSEAIKVTVPQPFMLSHMDASRQMAVETKMCKLKEELKSKLEKEMSIKIQSKPVPKSTYLPLYELMVEDSKKRKAQRKEKGAEVSSRVPHYALAAPGSAIPKEKLHTFRAKPAPKHILSDKISEKIKNKEAIRKMMIAQRAEELLKSSVTPFSRQPLRSHSALDLADVVREGESGKTTRKNISAITDRLYVKKCKKTMEDWDKKVFDHNLKVSEKNKNRTFITESKSLVPFSALPFSFFPVRMSNAAISRKRQIREELLARERRGNSRSNSEEDLLQRRREVVRAILPRLRGLLPMSDSQRDIEDKVRNFRATQSHRQREYEKEVEEIMIRVSKRLLLIERQSKVPDGGEDEECTPQGRGGSSGDPDSDSDVVKNEDDDGESGASEDSEL